MDSPALDGQERISSHHVGAERLVGWDPTVPRVDSPALDGQEGISSHHVGAERLVGRDPTVPRVDSPAPRRTGGDLLPSRGRRAVRPGNRQLSGLGSHALPRIGSTPSAAGASFLDWGAFTDPSRGTREAGGPSPTTSRVWSVSEDTGRGSKRARERLEHVRGKAEQGPRAQAGCLATGHARPDVRWSESCLFPFRSFRVKGTSGNGPSHGASLRGSASRPR